MFAIFDQLIDSLKRSFMLNWQLKSQFSCHLAFGTGNVIERQILKQT